RTMTLDDRFRGIDDRAPLQGLLGYLNFSEGRPDPRFQMQFLEAWDFVVQRGSSAPCAGMLAVLLHPLEELPQNRGGAVAALPPHALPDPALVAAPAAYRDHHRDLLAHQSASDLSQPLFLVRVCEAVLSQRGPWEETTRIVCGALKQLNDYVGHRPVPVLE